MTLRLAAVFACTLAWSAPAEADRPASHAAMRALPVASDRQAATGPVLHVDPARGDDAGDGSVKRPWKTLEAAAKRLRPGDTLYLHGGTYFEHATLAVVGTAKAPITIRSAPGELAILDGGLRELEEAAATAWEPVKGGAPGEFRSVHPVPATPAPAVAPGASSAETSANLELREAGHAVAVRGNFADSMVPLHAYRFAIDLRSTNQLWSGPGNTAPASGLYLGPGLWLDEETRRIHLRLTHTELAGQPDNYAGETDPRKLALVIGVERSALRIANAAYLRLEDVVVRGSAARTVEIADSHDVELDGVTIYGGAPALWVGSTHHLRVIRSALRGTAAPWSSRASMKYRSDAPYLMIADSGRPSRPNRGTPPGADPSQPVPSASQPASDPRGRAANGSGTAASGPAGAANHRVQSHDWELAYDEFTDGHDGVVIDSVKGLRFHHNLVDNFNDDGLYLTLPPRAWLPEDVQLYENVITRVYTALAFAEGDRAAAPNAIGPGVYIFRNLFDLRDGTYTWIPRDAGGAAIISASRMCGDHGTPVWEPLFFYHNTVINPGPAFRDYYGEQLVMGTKGTRRRLFNNLFIQVEGNPGLNVPGIADDLQADGNLMWGLRAGPSTQGQFFSKRTGQPGPAGFGEHDIYGDPQLVHLVDGDRALDIRPRGPGGVVDAGVKLPADWPDTLRAADQGLPDIGALPLGAPMLRVGPAAAPKR